MCKGPGAGAEGTRGHRKWRPGQGGAVSGLEQENVMISPHLIPPKMCPHPNPGTCDFMNLFGQRVFADVIKLRILR